jgi:hypothetical protein
MTPEHTVRWRCLDPLCEWPVVTTITPAEPPPRCTCGSTTQRIEQFPVTYLDFLRSEPFATIQPVAEEE